MVETHVDRRQSAGFEFMRDVARAEDAGREAHEGVEHDEDDVEIVDLHIGPRRRTLEKDKRKGREKCCEARNAVKARRQPVAGKYGQKCCGADWNQEDSRHRIEGMHAHRRSPRKSSSAETSTESKRSRIRNRKMPMTMKAIRIEKATLISPTSGVPFPPAAASNSP